MIRDISDNIILSIQVEMEKEKTGWFKLPEDSEFGEDSSFYRNLSASSSIADQPNVPFSTDIRQIAQCTVQQSHSNITDRSHSDSDLPRRLFGESGSACSVESRQGWASDFHSRNSSSSVSRATSGCSSLFDSRLRSAPASPSPSQLSHSSVSSTGQKKVWFALSEDCGSDSGGEASPRPSSSSSDCTQYTASLIRTPDLTQHTAYSQLLDSTRKSSDAVKNVGIDQSSSLKELTQYQVNPPADSSLRSSCGNSVRSSLPGDLTQFQSDSVSGNLQSKSRTKDNRDLTQYPWRYTPPGEITQHQNFSDRVSQASDLTQFAVDPKEPPTKQPLNLSDLTVDPPSQFVKELPQRRPTSTSWSSEAAKHITTRHPSVRADSRGRTSAVFTQNPKSQVLDPYTLLEQQSVEVCRHQSEISEQSSAGATVPGSCRTSGVGSVLADPESQPVITWTDSTLGEYQTSGIFSPSSLSSSQQTSSHSYQSQTFSYLTSSSTSFCKPESEPATPIPLNDPQTSTHSVIPVQPGDSLGSHTASIRADPPSFVDSKHCESNSSYLTPQEPVIDPDLRFSLQHNLSSQNTADRAEGRSVGSINPSLESGLTSVTEQKSLSTDTLDVSEWMPVSEDKIEHLKPGLTSSQSAPHSFGEKQAFHSESLDEPCTEQPSCLSRATDRLTGGGSVIGASTQTGGQLSMNLTRESGSSYYPLTEDTCSSQNSTNSWKMSSPERDPDQAGREQGDLSQVPNLSFNDSSKDSTSLHLSSPRGTHRYTSSDEDWRSETDGATSEAEVGSPARPPFSNVLMGLSEQAVHEALSGILQEQAVQSVVAEISNDFVSGNLNMDGRRSSDSSQLSSDREDAGIEREFRGSTSGLYPESYGGLSDVDWNIYTSNESDNNITPRSVASSGERETPIGADLSLSRDTLRPNDPTAESDAQDGMDTRPTEIRESEVAADAPLSQDVETSSANQHSQNRVSVETDRDSTDGAKLPQMDGQHRPVTPGAEKVDGQQGVNGLRDLSSGIASDPDNKDTEGFEAKVDANDSTSSESGRGSGSKSASLSEDYNLTKHDEMSFTYSEYSRENSNVSDVLSTDGRVDTETDTRGMQKEPVTSDTQDSKLTAKSSQTLPGYSSHYLSVEDRERLIIGQDQSSVDNTNSLVDTVTENLSGERFIPMNETTNSEYMDNSDPRLSSGNAQSTSEDLGQTLLSERPQPNGEESSKEGTSKAADSSKLTFLESLIRADDSEAHITNEHSYEALQPSFSQDPIRLSVSVNSEEGQVAPPVSGTQKSDKPLSPADDGNAGTVDKMSLRQSTPHSDGQRELPLSESCEKTDELQICDTPVSRFQSVSDRSSTPTEEASQLPDFDSLAPLSLLSAKSSSSFPLESRERRELSEGPGVSAHSDLYRGDLPLPLSQHSAPERLDHGSVQNHSDNQQTFPKGPGHEIERNITTRDSRLQSDSASDDDFKTNDDLSRKVENLLSHTAYLADQSEAVAHGVALVKPQQDHIDSPRDLDYDSLHKDLDIIQDSLKTSGSVPSLTGLDRMDLANSTADTTPPKLSYRSTCGTGSPTSDLDTSRRRFLWDYGADIGYDDGQGRFIGNIKDITGTEDGMSGSRTRLSNFSSRSATPMHDMESANQTLTDQEDVLGMPECSQSVLNLDETISEKGHDDLVPLYRDQLPAMTKPMVHGTRSKSLTELRERQSLTPTGSLASRVNQLLEREDPTQQAVSILRDVSAEEKHFLRQIAAEQRNISAGSESETSSTSTTPKISARKGIEISPRMNRSFSPEKYLHSPTLQRILEKNAAAGQDSPRLATASKYEFHPALRGHGAGSSAFSNATTFLSDQLEKMSARQFDQSIELRSPVRRVIDCYPLYRTESQEEEENRGALSYQQPRLATDRETTLPKQAWKERDAESQDESSRQQRTPAASSRLLNRYRSAEENSTLNSRPVPAGSSDTLQITGASVSQRSFTDSDTLQITGASVSQRSFTNYRTLQEDSVNSVSEYRTPNQVLAKLYSADQKTSPATNSPASSPSEISTTSPSDSDYSATRKRGVRARYRPYKPVGSTEVYYTESETDEKMSGTDSVTTVESTHPGSDDAKGPDFPAHVLGSRPDRAVDGNGVYGTRKPGAKKDHEAAASLSTIEEKSVADDKEKPPSVESLDRESETGRRSVERRAVEPQDGGGPSPRTQQILDRVDKTLQQHTNNGDKTSAASRVATQPNTNIGSAQPTYTAAAQPTSKGGTPTTAQGASQATNRAGLTSVTAAMAAGSRAAQASSTVTAEVQIRGANPELNDGNNGNGRRDGRRYTPTADGTDQRLPFNDRLPSRKAGQTDVRSEELRRGLISDSAADLYPSGSRTSSVRQETYGADLVQAQSRSSEYLPYSSRFSEEQLRRDGDRDMSDSGRPGSLYHRDGSHTYPLRGVTSSSSGSRASEDVLRVTGQSTHLSTQRSSSANLYDKHPYRDDRPTSPYRSRSLEDLSFTSHDAGRGSSSLASHAISPPSPHHSPILAQPLDYHVPSVTDARSVGRQLHQEEPRHTQPSHTMSAYVSVADRNKLTGLSPLPSDLNDDRNVRQSSRQFSRETIMKEPPRSGTRPQYSDRQPQHSERPQQYALNQPPREESAMDTSSELVDFDKVPVSRMARLLQDSLHQAEGSRPGVHRDINAYWERFQQLHTDSDSSMGSERLGALADLMRNPSRHVVKQYLTDREVERRRREAWVENDRAERRREEGERRRLVKAAKRQKIVDGSYSETLEESNGYSSERSRDENGFRKPDESSLKPYQRELSYDSSVIDTLYSIPEDPSIDLGRSPSSSSDTYQTAPRPARRQRHVIDPNMQKLKSKISKQRVKYEKQKRKEVQRLAKIQRLEELLAAKKSGKISNLAFEKEVANLSSSTVQASSSEMSSEISQSSTDFTAVSSQLSSEASSATLTPRSTSEDSTLEDLALMTRHHGTRERRAEQQGRQPRQSKAQPVELSRTRKDKYTSPVRYETGRRENQSDAKSPSRKKKGSVDEPPFLTQKVQYERRHSPSPSRRAKSPAKKTEKLRKELEKDASLRSTRDVSIMMPSPKVSTSRKSRRPEMVSSGVQTSPNLGQRMRSRSPSPSRSHYASHTGSKERKGEKPVRHRSASPKPRRSNSMENKPPKKNRRSLPAGSPGVAWFVPMDEPRPWRQPLRERQALAMSNYPDLPRPAPPTADPVLVQRRPSRRQEEEEASQVESFMQMYLTKSGRSARGGEDSLEECEDIKPLSKMTLQEAFLKFKGDVVSRSKARQRRIALASKERDLEEMLGAERAQLFMDQRYQDVEMQYHPLSENLFKPKKRSFTKSEMKELTARLYNKLPEVVQKRQEEKRSAEYRVNRIRAKMFNKKVQRNVLGKPSPWYA